MDEAMPFNKADAPCGFGLFFCKISLQLYLSEKDMQCLQSKEINPTGREYSKRNQESPQPGPRKKR